LNSEYAIIIKDLKKVYKGSIDPALDGISLNIPKGSIFGLLGPNGAGKTTTISILCGLLKADRGEVSLNNMNISNNLAGIKESIGVVPQDIALYPTLTARENLQFTGRMYGIAEAELNRRINENLNRFGLEKFAKRKIGTFSGGMKRRINLIAGILHYPEILILDEPTVGVDVQSRNVILDYLREINKRGTTIIYTSHYMEEAEHLCTDIAIIDQGHIIALGRPVELIASKAEYNTLEDIFLNLTGRTLRDQ
jgi:ABC-2 type transport system ATP-binding protein